MKFTITIIALVLAVSVKSSVIPITFRNAGLPLTYVNDGLQVLHHTQGFPVGHEFVTLGNGLTSTIGQPITSLGFRNEIVTLGNGLSSTIVRSPLSYSSPLSFRTPISVGLPITHSHVVLPADHITPSIVPVATEGTYTAINNGAVHVASLPGHLHSAQSVNLEKAPGTF